MSHFAAKGISRRQLAGAVVTGIVAAPRVVRAQETVELTLACPGINDTWDSRFDQVIELFVQANPGFRIQIDRRPADGYMDRLVEDFEDGDAPDISLMQMDWVAPGLSHGMWTNLLPLFDRDGIDRSAKWIDPLRDWSFGGGLFGAVIGGVGGCVYVNTDILSSLNVPFPADDWNWDDLLSAALSCSDPGNDRFGVHIGKLPPPHWSEVFIRGAGGSVLNETHDQCIINSTEARSALQWIVDLIHVHKVMPNPLELDSDEHPFMDGKVAFYFGDTNEIPAIRDSGIAWDFARMPFNSSTGINSVQLGSHAAGILSSTSHPEESWNLVKHLASAEGARAMMDFAIPSVTQVIESPEFLEAHVPQDMSTLAWDLRNASHQLPLTQDAFAWWPIMEMELAPIWTGEDMVENCTQRAADRVNAIFAGRSS